MRFERLGHTPVLVRELDVDGASVTIREDAAAPVTTTFESPTAARDHADALVATWRLEGYVLIKRLAPVAAETPIRRDRRFEWIDRDKRMFREVLQRDDAVRIIDGQVIDGGDHRHAPETLKRFSIREASETYERCLVRTEEEMAAARERTERAAQRQAVRAKKTERDRYLRNIHPGLEAECLASRDAPGPWQVYADWLLDREDPVGEIAALALGGDTRAAYTAAHDHFADLDGVDLALRHGFVHHLTIRATEETCLEDVMRRVLVLPICRFVESIRLGLASAYYDNDWAPALAVITDAYQAPNLRALHLDGFSEEECMLSHASYGSLGFAWAKLPMLEELRLRGSGEGDLGALDIAKLRVFVHEATNLRRDELVAICAVDRPHLEHLELWTGSDQAATEITLTELEPILDAVKLPALRHLGIVNSDLSDVIIPALATSRLLPQLYSLDLSQGIFARTAAALLVAHAPRFRHLASFDLSENVLLDDEIAELRGVLDNIITHGQREREDDFPDDPGMRYVATYE